MIPYSISPGKSVSVFLNGCYKTVPSTSVNYKALVDALLAEKKDLDLICELADISTFIAKKTFGAVQISDDRVRWNGKDVHGVIVDRIFDHLKRNLELTPLVNFLDRLMKNPTIGVRDDMFAWLESGNAPITPDGFFLAFKAVRCDYKDKHTGTMDNSVGQVVSMPRDEVDDVRENECSRGLHFCSHGYLRTFYSKGDKVVVLQIDPADVVAIPTDYNRQKGRAWRYEVIGEIEYGQAETFYSNSPVVEVVRNEEAETVPAFSGIAEYLNFNDGDMVYYVGPGHLSFSYGGEYHLISGTDSDIEVEVENDEAQECYVDAEYFTRQKPPVYKAGDQVVFIGQDDNMTTGKVYTLDAEMDSDHDLYVMDDERGSNCFAVRQFRLATAADGVTPSGNEADDGADKTNAPDAAGPERQFYSKTANKSFLASEIVALVREHGRRGMERLTGVPRSTIQDWLKVIEG